MVLLIREGFVVSRTLVAMNTIRREAEVKKVTMKLATKLRVGYRKGWGVKLTG